MSTTISEKMDYLVPAAKIADMATGWLAGQAARDFTATDERMLDRFDIEQSEEFKTTKYFCKTHFDMKKIKDEEEHYVPLPKIYEFKNDREKEILLNRNFKRVNQEVEALKIIAVLSMVTDRCAYYLLDESSVAYEVMRCFGRIAFPVFAFLIAEGFAHTRNRMRYFLSLLLFAAISEFTLALGVMALAVFESLREHRVLCCCSMLLMTRLAAWSGTGYEWRGVLVITVFYLLGMVKNTPVTLRRMLQLLFAFPIMMHYGITRALLACSVIFLYDGTRGFIHGNVAKYGFYAFYPAHLIIIWLFARSDCFTY